MAAPAAEGGEAPAEVPNYGLDQSADLIDKLLLLGYLDGFCRERDITPFHRQYFPLPAPNPGLQFSNFLSLAQYLLGLCRQKFAVDKMEDPPTAINRLVLQLRDMGLELDFPPQKLRTGSGLPVLRVLLFLADSALTERGFQFDRPRFPALDEDAAAGVVFEGSGGAGGGSGGVGEEGGGYNSAAAREEEEGYICLEGDEEGEGEGEGGAGGVSARAGGRGKRAQSMADGSGGGGVVAEEDVFGRRGGWEEDEEDEEEVEGTTGANGGGFSGAGAGGRSGAEGTLFDERRHAGAGAAAAWRHLAAAGGAGGEEGKNGDDEDSSGSSGVGAGYSSLAGAGAGRRGRLNSTAGKTGLGGGSAAAGAAGAGAAGSEDPSLTTMLVSKVDPVAWRAELERLATAGKLKQPSLAGGGGLTGVSVGGRLGGGGGGGGGGVLGLGGGGGGASSREWRSHLEQTSAAQAVIGRLLPATKTELERLAVELTEVLESLGSREGFLNNSVRALAQEHSGVAEKLAALQASFQGSGSRVAVLTNELAQLNDNIEEVRATLEERGSSMADTSPLIRIKAALAALRAETKTMELHIGVVGHAVISTHKVHHNTAGGGRKQGAGGEEEEGDDAGGDSDD